MQDKVSSGSITEAEMAHIRYTNDLVSSRPYCRHACSFLTLRVSDAAGFDYGTAVDERFGLYAPHTIHCI